MTHLFDPERILIRSRPRGSPTRSLPRKTRCVTFLLSSVKSLRLSFTISEQKKSKNWRAGGADVASEHASIESKMNETLPGNTEKRPERR